MCDMMKESVEVQWEGMKEILGHTKESDKNDIVLFP